jgi:protein subunit release factor A
VIKIYLVDEYERLIKKWLPRNCKRPEAYRKLVRAQRDMEEVVQKYRMFEIKERNLAHAEGMLRKETDPELLVLAQEEKIHFKNN